MAARVAKMMSQMALHLGVDEITLAPRWTDLKVEKISLDFLN
jgi:hypothetical protein